MDSLFRFWSVSPARAFSTAQQIHIYCRPDAVPENVLIHRVAAAVDGLQQPVSLDQSSLVVSVRGKRSSTPTRTARYAPST